MNRRSILLGLSGLPLIGSLIPTTNLAAVHDEDEEIAEELFQKAIKYKEMYYKKAKISVDDIISYTAFMNTTGTFLVSNKIPISYYSIDVKKVGNPLRIKQFLVEKLKQLI